MSIRPDLPSVEWWPVATIEPSADGTWQPTSEQPGLSKPECMLYQLQEADGSLYDVVAWEASHPQFWWRRWGRATFMGEWCIEKANREGQPVWLVPTPDEYLRHSPNACCILRWDADVRAILRLAQHGWICTRPTLWRRAEAAARERRTFNVQLVA
jgi:hypothetical protein